MAWYDWSGYIPPGITNLGHTQTTDFNPFTGHFFAQPGEKMTSKRRKYHAAAG
jgi:hypothetical protein